MARWMVFLSVIGIFCISHAVCHIQLRITPHSLKNHQTVMAANFPFTPPINVEMIDVATGLVQNDSNLIISAFTWRSSRCLSDPTFVLSNGVGQFHGSICEPTDTIVYIYFQCNSRFGILQTNLTKAIRVINDVHLAYFQPIKKEVAALDDMLEEFLQYAILQVNNGQYDTDSFHDPLKGRALKMKTYSYDVDNPTRSIISTYLNMKSFHERNHEQKAYAIIGLNSNLAAKTVLPILMEDKYAVISYREDVSIQFVQYPFFNRIHLSDDLFMQGVLLYLQKRKWSKINVVYTSDNHEVEHASFDQSAIKYGITVTKHKIIPNKELADFKSLFESIIDSGIRVIMTTVAGKVAEQLILEADKYNVTSINKFQWIGLKNEKEFISLLENEPYIMKDMSQESCQIYNGFITMRFKGMIFINTVYHVNIYNNSKFEHLLHNYIDGSEPFKAEVVTNNLVSFALAYDVLFTYIYALQGLISTNSTINAVSLSQYIRNYTNFIGVTGNVHINPSTGNRDDFIASIDILWPDLLFNTHFNPQGRIFNYNMWRDVRKNFLFRVILIERNGSMIIERKVLTYKLLKLFMLTEIDSEEGLYNAHIPLTYWSGICGKKEIPEVRSQNSVMTARCKGYFHNHYQLLINTIERSQFNYHWYWPKIISECQKEEIEMDLPAPFYCDHGCGGNNSKSDVNIYDNGECIARNVCRCEQTRWRGYDCSIPVCEDSCEVHGYCKVPGNCTCSIGYIGSSCSTPVCAPECNFPGGECVKPNMCECDITNYGDYCEKTCSCKSKGKCNNGINGDGHCAECNFGYYGQDCDWHIVVIAFLAVIGITFLFAALCVVIRSFRRELQIKTALVSKDWVIDWSQVTIPDDITSRRKSLSAISMNSNRRIERRLLNIGLWKGIDIYYQKIGKDSISMSKEVQLEVQFVRELKHPNIVPLLGCSVEPPNIAILTELQQKGSIADIFENEDIKVPWNFRFCLMRDICKGLSYIHGSEIKSHGRLKSSNCLVDNKWTVKISGFGLHEFRSGQNNVGEYIPGICSDVKLDGCDYNSLLWTSPEILSTCVYHIDHVGCGTVNGDIYSFGMILSEFCTRELPFANVMLESSEMIRLIAGVQHVPSLKIWSDYIAKNNVEEGGWVRPCIRDTQWPSKFEVREKFKKLIESCWDEDPLKRPTIKQCEVALNQIDSQRAEPLERLVTTLEMYSTNLENVVQSRHEKLQDEVQRTEDLLSHLPRSVIEDLKQGKMVEPEQLGDVTIYISNLIGISNIFKTSTALEAITFLNDIYNLFDRITAEYDVVKVESICCTFMFASGLSGTNERDRQTGEVCAAALKLMNSLSSFEIAHVKNAQLSLQVGIHTGDVVAGVVGIKMPRFCFFGDTVDIAVKMETTGAPGFIQLTEDTFNVLDSIGGFVCEYRHEIRIKSRTMNTYWLKVSKIDKVEVHEEEPSALSNIR